MCEVLPWRVGSIGARTVLRAHKMACNGKRVIYTVSTGGYDIDIRHHKMSPDVTRGIDFVRFVDRESLAKLSHHDTSPWRNVLLDPTTVAAASTTTMSATQLLSRDVKLRPHRYPLLWRYHASLYVDSNVRIHHPVDTVFAHVEDGAADLAAFDFPRTLDNEAKWVERYLLVKQARWFNVSATSRAALGATLAAQVADYKAHGDHLWNRTMYGKVIARRHGDRVRYFGERWWQELNRGVPRDQLSFRFCAADAGRRVGLRTRAKDRGSFLLPRGAAGGWGCARVQRTGFGPPRPRSRGEE